MQETSHPMEPAEIMAYLDGELPVERAAAAAAHLEHCGECQSLAADLRAVSEGMRAWQVEASEAAPPVAANEKRGSRRGRGIRPWAWAPLACGLGGLALLVAIEMPRRQSGQVRMAMAVRELGSRAEDVAGQPAPVPAQAGAPPAAALAAATAPMVARTAALSLSTGQFDRVRPALDAVIQRHNGYLGSLNVTAPSGAARNLTAAVRVPAPDLNATLDELKKLGRVESEEQSGEEVGEQFRDLEARLANARNTEQRLTDILRQRTGKLSDVLEVERELDRVRGEIERMDGEKKGLARRVDYATVNLTVSEAYREPLEAVPDSTWARIRNAGVAGYRTMTGGLVAVILPAVAAAPTVLLWTALLFFPARYVWRRRRRRE